METKKNLSATIIFSVAALLSATAMARSKEAGIEGSIKVSKDQQKNYYHLAAVSLQDAIGIAQSSTQGNVISSALEIEKGFLVYAVNLDRGDKVIEVIIDAGNGKVLKTENEDKRKHRSTASEEDDNE